MVAASCNERTITTRPVEFNSCRPLITLSTYQVIRCHGEYLFFSRFVTTSGCVYGTLLRPPSSEKLYQLQAQDGNAPNHVFANVQKIHFTLMETSLVMEKQHVLFLLFPFCVCVLEIQHCEDQSTVLTNRLRTFWLVLTFTHNFNIKFEGKGLSLKVRYELRLGVLW